jgi:ribonuclease R
MKTDTGIISITRKGFGFISHPDHAEDIYVNEADTGAAFHGDTVEYQVKTGPSSERRMTGQGQRGQQTARPRGPEGKVVKVLERARTQFVGTLTKTGSDHTLTPDNIRIPHTFIVKEVPADLPALCKALVTLVRFDAGTQPIATFTRLLGESGLYATEMAAIALSCGFEDMHSEAARAEADAWESKGAVQLADIAARRDFRTVPTCTIDPVDAKDFDDALSVQTLPDGSLEVGVHIADVSHFVTPGSALDEEAKHRATSVYLVGHTVPMLPEALSNNLCSLVPHQDRLTYSAVFTFTPAGTLATRWFGRTVIHSDKRFSYQEAQDVLDGKQDGPFKTELSLLKKYADVMRAERSSDGAISFETDEVKFVLDDQGKPVDVTIKERLDTMKMIEDWMLLANKEVAHFVSEKIKDKQDVEKTFIYRIHNVPDQDRIEELRIFIKSLGYDLGDPSRKVRNSDINKVLDSLEGKPERALIQMATLRSMAKAVYSHENVGHFSLAFNHYTHFTSPIRRYPDVLVHRLLEAHVTGTKIAHKELAEYRRMAVKSSEQEVSAVEAERASIRYMQVEWLKGKVGQEFVGSISGVAEAGMFIVDQHSKSEGLIPMRAIGDDYYMLEKEKYRIIGTRRGKIYRMGDTVKVKLFSVDAVARQVEWRLVD